MKIQIFLGAKLQQVLHLFILFKFQHKIGVINKKYRFSHGVFLHTKNRYNKFITHAKELTKMLV